MKPTYKILPSYDHLIDNAVFKNYYVNNADLDMTIEGIKEVIHRFRKQVSKLAKHLKGNSLEQSALNLWHWEINNLQYAPDGDGEELRTPARAYADGQPGGPGVDCDCLTMFGASVMLNNNYPVTLNIVALNNNPNYGHIFLTVGKKSTYHPDINGYVIDPCPPLNEFDQIAPNITKVMKLSILNGINGMDAAFNKSGADAPQEELECPHIYGINGFAAPDDITRQLLAQQQLLKQQLHHRPFDKVLNAELRKISFVIGLNTMHEERAKILAIMPYVQDISKDGSYIYKPEANLDVINGFLAGVISEQDLGSFWKHPFHDIAKAANNVNNAVAKAANAVATEIKKDAGKAWKFVKKFNPVTILIRGGVILAVTENVHGMASKLRVGLLTEQEAVKQGYRKADWQAMKGEVDHLAHKFKDVGGDEGKLFSAIRKGSGKKHLLGMEDIQGLGEPLTLAAGITAASGILIPLISSLAKKKTNVDHVDANGVSYDKDGKVVIPTLTKDSSSQNPIEKLATTLGYDTKKSFMDNINDFGKTVSDMSKSLIKTPSAISTTKATIGIVGVGVAGAILFAANKKGKKSLSGIPGGKRTLLIGGGALTVGYFLLSKKKAAYNPNLPIGPQNQPPTEAEMAAETAKEMKAMQIKAFNDTVTRISKANNFTAAQSQYFSQLYRTYMNAPRTSFNKSGSEQAINTIVQQVLMPIGPQMQVAS